MIGDPPWVGGGSSKIERSQQSRLLLSTKEVFFFFSFRECSLQYAVFLFSYFGNERLPVGAHRSHPNALPPPFDLGTVMPYPPLQITTPFRAGDIAWVAQPAGELEGMHPPANRVKAEVCSFGRFGLDLIPTMGHASACIHHVYTRVHVRTHAHMHGWTCVHARVLNSSPIFCHPPCGLMWSIAQDQSNTHCTSNPVPKRG